MFGMPHPLTRLFFFLYKNDRKVNEQSDWHGGKEVVENEEISNLFALNTIKWHNNHLAASTFFFLRVFFVTEIIFLISLSNSARPSMGIVLIFWFVFINSRRDMFDYV